MLKMVDGTGIIGVDMVCPLGGAVSPPQPPNYDKVEVEGVGSLMLPNSLEAPLERLELIGNSMQGENPSPDNPQEIKSAGRKSKNLFNKNTAKQGYEFPSAGSDVEALKEGWFVSDFMPVKATTYYISGKATGSGCKLYNKDKVFVKNMQAPFGNIKFDEGIAYFRINGEIKDLDKIQVEEGIVATDYKPYGYLFDVKVTGKNLFDITKYDKYDDTWTNATYTTKKLKLKPNTTYTMSCKRLVDKPKQYVLFLVEEGIASGRGIYVQVTPDLSVNYFISKGTFTTNDTGEITLSYYVDCPKEQYWFTEVIGDIQIEEGNKATPYEPYTEQSMQIALDEPLRGIGDYKDMLTKDGVVRKIKRVVFDENTPFKEYNAPVQVKTTSFISGTTIKDATGETGIEVMSDRFKAKDRGFDRYDEECITLFGKNIFVRFNKDKNINTAEALTEWLKQNPLTVDYVLAEPVTEPLPESVQQQLQALRTENGITHVFVDSGEVPCGIKLTYRKEK